MGALHIVSRSSEPFADRIEAGELLAEELEAFREEKPVILGILRGGIVVAERVARALDAELDIVLARKLGAPFNPELALGAVGESGRVYLNENVSAGVSAGLDYLDAEKKKQLEVISELRFRLRRIISRVPLEGRTAIVVDDGIATGATMQASIWSMRHEKPAKIVAALPVAPEESLKSLAAEADAVICLRVPRMFAAVGQFYASFRQVSTDEAEKILGYAAGRRKDAAASFS